MKLKYIAFGFLLVLLINLACAKTTIDSLSPMSGFADSELEFKVNVTTDSEVNIEEYKWQFGDGVNVTTTSDRLNHTYYKSGTYNLKITVTDSDDETYSKTFKVVISLTKESINASINKKFEYIDEVKIQIEEDFSEIQGEKINAAIDFDNLENELDSIIEEYNNAVSDKDFTEVSKTLEELKIPRTIFVSESIDSSVFYSGEENINFGAIEEIAGGVYESDNDEQYITSLYEWNTNNLNTKIKYEELSLQYSAELEEPFLKFFELQIKEKNAISEDYYIIIKDMEDLEFDEDYSEEQKSGYYYIKGEDDLTISFSTTEDVNFVTLPAVISPSLEELNIVPGTTTSLCNKDETCDKERGENWQNCEDCESERTQIIIYAIGGIVLFGVIIWIIMILWFKSSYEGHLFKNQRDLYNIMVYIDNAKRHKFNDIKIKNDLKKSGWKSEQISYALKKYAKKKTG